MEILPIPRPFVFSILFRKKNTFIYFILRTGRRNIHVRMCVYGGIFFRGKSIYPNLFIFFTVTATKGFQAVSLMSVPLESYAP